MFLTNRQKGDKNNLKLRYRFRTENRLSASVSSSTLRF